MFLKQNLGAILAGLAAGFVTGLFGGGGGMILVPLLSLLSGFREEEIFPASVCVILPICIVSLVLTAQAGNLPWEAAAPYLLGSGLGGLAAGIWGRKIPASGLHKGLGILMLWGGYRYLC